MKFASFRTTGPLTDEHEDVYVERQADSRALTYLSGMDYLLIVEPRQQGKTSLINFLMRHPGLDDVAFVYLDIASTDRSTQANWYKSLCPRILRQLRNCLPRDQWPRIPHNSTQWRDFLSDVAISVKRRVIIALDEIGAVTFPGATEFFSVLRDVYGSRQSETEFKRLAFVLSGAFHPRDLIRDDRISPFNIARRVRLPDFTLTQVRELVAKGGADELTDVLAERIFFWTGGQPYLTQFLCLQLEIGITPSYIDSGVEQLFRNDENHLPGLLERINSNRKLRQYIAKIRSGEQVYFFPSQNSLQAQLELLGVLKADEHGYCKIRNRIYEWSLAEITEGHIGRTQEMTRELPPEVEAQAITFLFEIGRWAASELKERWRFARQKKEAGQTTEVDFSKPKEEVEQQAEALLQEMATDYGAAEVERVLQLIERKRDLILEWKEIKVDNEQAFNRDEIKRSALRLKQEELDEKISSALSEIEADLNELGVQVWKQAANQPD